MTKVLFLCSLKLDVFRSKLFHHLCNLQLRGKKLLKEFCVEMRNRNKTWRLFFTLFLIFVIDLSETHQKNKSTPTHTVSIKFNGIKT